jgi:hypothetical protein
MKLRKILNEILNEISLTFNNEMIGYSHGQSDMSLIAFSGKVPVGKLDYSEYEESPSVKMLEVPNEYRRQGIGTQLLKQLQKKYPNKEIDLGMLSDDGAALIKTVNRKFIPNKSFEKLNNRLEFIKNEINRIKKMSDNGNYSENSKLNDFHDEKYEIEDKLNDIKKGKWIIK